MKLYIVAKIITNQGVACYKVVDADNNFESIFRPKNVIVATLKRGVQIENVKLVGNHISGKYYSLDTLPVYDYVNNTITNNKRVCLKNKNNNQFLIYSNVGADKGFANVVDYNTVCELIRSNSIANIKVEVGSIKIACETEITEHLSIATSAHDLDKEVRDPSILWTIATFDKYMKSHGFTYEISKNNDNEIVLKNIDSRCIDVHMPCGVTIVENLYEKPTKNIRTLIFCPTLIAFNSIDETTKNNDRERTYISGSKLITHVIENLYFQNEVTFKPMFHFDNLEIHNVIDLTNFKTIVGRFNNCKLNSVKLSSETNLIDESFNMCAFSNRELLLDVGVSNSFNNCNLTKVKVGSHATNINNSFNCYIDTLLTLESIDFSDAVGLKSMNGSFKGTTKLYRIDLTGCKNLSSIYDGCFSLTYDMTRYLGNDFRQGIKEVVLPIRDNTNRLYISGDFCVGSKIHEITIPEYVEVGSATLDADIINIKGNSSIFESRTIPVVKYTRFNDVKQINLENSITKVTRSSMNNMNKQSQIDMINPSIYDAEFSPSAFASTSFDVLDMRSVKHIKLEEYSFYNACINTLILGETTPSMPDKMIGQMSSIKNLVILSGVTSVNDNSINKLRSNSIQAIKVYVVKGSAAEKKYNRFRGGMALIVCNNDEEAVIKALGKEFATTEDEYNKMKMIMTDSNLSSLLDEENKDAAKVNYVMYDNCNNTVLRGNKCFDSLNEFKEKPVKEFRILDDIDVKFELEQYRTKEQEEETKNTKLADIFVGLVDLIIKFSDGKNFTLAYREKIANASISGRHYALYIDDMSAIITKKVNIDSKNVELTFVIINNTVVFISAARISFLYDTEKTPYDIRVRRDDRYNISANLQIGDTFGYKEYTAVQPKVLGQKLKREIFSMADLNMTNGMLWLGGEKFVSHDSVSMTFILYELTSERFLIAKGYVSSVEFSDCTIMKVVPLADFEHISKVNRNITSIIRTILQVDSNDKNYNKLKSLLLEDSDADKLLVSENAYDEGINTSLLNLADEVYQQGIRDYKTLPLDLLNKLLETNLVTECNVSLNKCIKQKYPLSEIIEYTDECILGVGYDKKIVMEEAMRDGIELYDHYIGVIGENTLKSSTKVFKKSIFKLEDLCKMLYSIGHVRAAMKSPILLNKIVSDQIDISQFYVIGTFVIRTTQKFHICIEYTSGNAYFIAEDSDMWFYTMLRFKSVYDAFEIFRNIKYADDAESVLLRKSVRCLAEYLIENKQYYNSKMFNDAMQIHEAVLSGKPNGFDLPINQLWLFEKVAKQHA